MKNTNRKIGLILNDDTPETVIKKRISLFILFLILVSSLEVILESVNSLNVKYYQYFFIIDAAVSILFSIEYILRLWTYRIDGEKPTLKQRFSNITSFYMMIDLISIIPFYLSLFIPTGYSFIRIVRILRLFRLMKFGRYMKSQNLVVNAIKNKGKELILSMQVVVFLTVILSAILYHIENSVQPDNFGDILDAFVWSLSKFIGGVGGYGAFEPITFWGQVMATIVGLLGIALFAVPAGIIGAGFVEEIEAIKAYEDNTEKNNELLSIFEFDHLGSWIRCKKEIGLEHIRRKVLKISDAKMRLLLTDDEIINIARGGKGIRLKNFVSDGIEKLVIESFTENVSYGTLTNNNSKITVVCTHSAGQPFLGHFTYVVSEYLKANYISVEKCSNEHFNPAYKVVINKQKAYLDGSNSKNQFVSDFKNDLLNTVENNSLVIYFRCGAKGKGDFHLLNGGTKGTENFISANSLFAPIEKLDAFRTELEKTHKKLNSESLINTHEHYGNDDKEEFQWMLKKENNANILCIYVTAKLLNSAANVYYPTIQCIGDAIKKELT
jgi:voltage-gated potassium channel